MQIERAEFLSNQELGLQSFGFNPNRLNLLSTDDDQKKADLFSAISLVLWGSRQEINGNLASKLKEGKIELALNGKKLTMFRNFDSDLLELKADAGLTIGNTSELISGISKDMFNSLFLVGQEEGGKLNFVNSGTLLSFLGQFSSLSEHSISIDKSVKLLEEKLESYAFHDKTYKIDDLISGLSRGKIVLEERLLQLKAERNDSSAHIDELNKLEVGLSQARRTQKREEYFKLCLETAELDARIMKVQQRLLHEAELKQELSALSYLWDFPVDALRKVQELWTMRQSRKTDLDRLNEDIAASDRETEIVEETYAKEAKGLDQFLIEDSQELYSLSKIISTCQADLEQLKQDRAQEMRRMKDAGVDFDSISLVRKTLLTMIPFDLEESNKLSDDFKSQKEKLGNLVSLSENAASQLKMLSTELSSYNEESAKLKNVLLGLILVSALAVIALFIIHTPATELCRPIFLTVLVLLPILLGFLQKKQLGTRQVFEAKIEGTMKQQNQYTAEELVLSETIRAIQSKAESIAIKYDLASTADLFKKLQMYGKISARLKQLDVLDHMLATREQQLSKLSKEALAYFERIDHKLIQVTPTAITGLASEIMRFRERSKELDRSSAVHSHKKSERSFLEGEILDLDSVLRDQFWKARLPQPDNLEDSFIEFEQKAQAYRKWESLSLELESLGKSLSSEILEQDLSTMLHTLQHRRTEAWGKMQDLIDRYPDMLSEMIEDEEIGRLTQGEAQTIEEGLMQKQARADALRLIIRTAAKNFDEFHPKIQHELEILDRDLGIVKHNQSALTLARDSLMQVARESKSFWSQELAEISTEMLADSGLEVNKIEWDENMEMTLRLATQDEPVHESSLAGKVPHGLIKQINWISRLMLCLYIARRSPLPVVLDEPFFDLDDRRFACCMNLLLQKILPHCQLIVLTCQRVRHQWFIDKLSEQDKMLIQFI